MARDAVGFAADSVTDYSIVVNPCRDQSEPVADEPYSAEARSGV